MSRRVSLVHFYQNRRGMVREMEMKAAPPLLHSPFQHSLLSSTPLPPSTSYCLSSLFVWLNMLFHIPLLPSLLHYKDNGGNISLYWWIIFPSRVAHDILWTHCNSLHRVPAVIKQLQFCILIKLDFRSPESNRMREEWRGLSHIPLWFWQIRYELVNVHLHLLPSSKFPHQFNGKMWCRKSACIFSFVTLRKLCTPCPVWLICGEVVHFQPTTNTKRKLSRAVAAKTMSSSL